MMPSRTLTLEQAAEVLKTTAETVSDCVHNRGLPAAKIGRAFVLVEDDVIDWLRTQYGNWRSEPCGSISAANEERGGLTSAMSQASALDAALAPLTTSRRRSTPPRLRPVSGGRGASEKPRG
jgi:excisionase family DNA binding protein